MTIFAHSNKQGRLFALNDNCLYPRKISNNPMRFILTLIILTSSFCASLAQNAQMAALNNVVPGSYNFWLYSPAQFLGKQHDGQAPLVIFLHGASLCGRNLERVRTYGPLVAVQKGRNIPAMILAPQNPGGAWSPKKVNMLVDWVEEHYDIDTTRIYVIGMSLGGYGTMDYAGTYPHRVAAAMALCGGTTLKTKDGLGQLPLWIMHGTADRAVSINESKKVVNYLEQQGATNLLRYDWLPGASHGAPARLFYMEKTYEWFFSHQLTDEPRQVNRDVDIQLSDLSKAYNNLPRGGVKIDIVSKIPFNKKAEAK